MFDELSERHAVVSTTPLGLAHGLSAYLKEYPYGCTEQITSRAYPWLVFKDDANFGIDPAEAARVICRYDQSTLAPPRTERRIRLLGHR
jgi:alpha-2-macroglobulin